TDQQERLQDDRLEDPCRHRARSPATDSRRAARANADETAAPGPKRQPRPERTTDMNGIETAIYDIAKALRVPVLVLALAAVALTLIELGAFVVELVRRRRRDFINLEAASTEARAALDRGDETAAKSALRPVAWSTQMARTLAFLVDQ